MPAAGFAVPYRFPESFPAEALSDTLPFTFSPNGMDLSDFEPLVLSGAVPDVRLKLESRSFEWVRVGEVLMVPRASLRIEAAGYVGGQVDVLDFSKRLRASEDGKLVVSVPVALLGPLSGNRIHLRLLKPDGSEHSVELGVRHRKNAPADDSHAFGVDSSCSPYGISLSDVRVLESQWIYVGCRYVLGGGESFPVPEIELFVLWDGAEKDVRVDEIATPPVRPGVWKIRRNASPGEVRFKDSGGRSFSVNYRIPDRFRSASLGLGIGPYAYSFTGVDQASRSVVPLMTLYGSYYLSDPNRIVMFNATSFQRNFFSDTGIYFQTEQFTVLDRRLTMRILLGLHVLIFPSYRGTETAFSGPQGAELIFRDFGLRRYNLAVGAFVYPLINERSYYNLWLRWGTSRFFGEFNYISWQERLPRSTYGSESVGISVGGPLFSFF